MKNIIRLKIKSIRMAHSVADAWGFTLIELLIVVAIIGILAAISVPAYMGLQEKARTNTLIRVASSSVPEIQSWMQTASANQSFVELDTNGDGIIGPGDLTNGQLLAAGVEIVYASAKNNLNAKSPWDSTKELWYNSTPADAAGRYGYLMLTSTTQGLVLTAYGKNGGLVLYKTIFGGSY